MIKERKSTESSFEVEVWNKKEANGSDRTTGT
jgi:hypothetical protein